MLSPDLPRTPAFSQLRPENPDPALANSDISNAICTALDRKGIVRHLTETSKFSGTFVFEPENGALQLVKVIPYSRIGIIREIDAITIELGDLAPGSLRLDEASINGHQVITYPFIKGRRVDATPEDMWQVGRSIAEIHLALAKIKSTSDIREQSLQWYKYLEFSAEKVTTQYVDVFPDKAVKLLAENFDKISELVDTDDSQILHGDLNYGNILIRDDNNKAVVVDFENVIRSYSDIKVDISFAIERFCFPDHSDRQLQKILAQSLLRGYQSKSGEFEFTSDQMVECLKVWNIRCIAAQAAIAINNEELTPGELKKFTTLMNDIPNKANTVFNNY